jgi:serine/threonine-protein kinase
MQDYKGHTLDNRYLVENRIGKGGMGVVYQGRHVIIGRKVAIKFLSSEFARSEEIVTRFYREAQTATQIGHKNIIEILDVGTSDQHDPFIVMEYLEGEDLGSLLKRKKTLNLSAACGILEPVLSALSSAHEKGVVHRDLKPENIFLHHDPSSGEVIIKLIDFGISKLMNPSANEKLTLTGSALGTPHYMSPEQTSGADEVDHRTDIYAMGVILFEILTGETPYTASSHQALVVKILTEEPRDPYDVNPDFPDEALPIVKRALCQNALGRYQTAVEMLDALRRLSIYEDRVTQLTACTSSIKERRGAVGDLGVRAGSGGGSGSARALQDLARRGTLGSWAGSKPSSLGTSTSKSLRIALLLGTAAVLILGGLALYLWMRTNQNTNAVVYPAASAPLATPSTVRITLTGVPQGAQVLFGDNAVSSNAFDIPLAKAARELVIKSPGYLPFQKEIIPDRNQAVDVELVPIVSASTTLPDTDTPISTTAPEKKPMNMQSKSNVHQPPIEGEKPASNKDGFIQGRRKTEIAETFE